MLRALIPPKSSYSIVKPEAPDELDIDEDGKEWFKSNM